MARRQQLASPMSEFLGISAVGVILVFGGMLVINRSLNAGEFVAFIAMFSQITRPVRSFIDQFANINQGVAAGERILMLLDTKTEVPDAPDARTLDGLHEGIGIPQRALLLRRQPRGDRRRELHDPQRAKPWRW